ncbi:MAG: dihydrofolate reductase family protein [Anaerolineae bacterium]|nr:dihydrofolate reductase family protein [Anaerolineae bacterium]
MGNVGAGFSMSLDGFIAGPNDEVDRVFAWMSQGDTEVKVSTGDHDIDLKMSEESAELYEEIPNAIGALVLGRRIFDVAGAWGGKHPLGAPMFIVTHRIPEEWVYEGSPFTFVTDGVESAVAQAQAVAGDKSVGVAGANIMQQCLKAGLLDEIGIDLVPVLLGQGIRMFEYLGIEQIELEQTSLTNTPGVTHIRYRVVK